MYHLHILSESEKSLHNYLADAVNKTCMDFWLTQYNNMKGTGMQPFGNQ